jgi:RNA polymerase sigma-70 factor (ECF subfamily)
MLSRRAFAPDLTLVRPDHRSRAMFSAMSQPLEDDDFAAFMAVFVAHQRRIFGYIGSLLPTSADHEDVYQQTCMALWRKRHSYDPARPFFAWACGFARNEVLKHVRDSRPGVVYFSEKLLEELDAIVSAEGSQESADEARHTALESCLGELHERQRSLVERCYKGVESIKAVATEMAISPAALTMRLQRIRHSLLKCIELALGSR